METCFSRNCALFDYLILTIFYQRSSRAHHNLVKFIADPNFARLYWPKFMRRPRWGLLLGVIMGHLFFYC